MIHKQLKTGAAALAVAFSMLFSACNSGSYSSGNINLSSNVDSVSYAFGYLNGKQMSQQGMDDLNPKIFAEAMQQAFAGDTAQIQRVKLHAMLRRYQMEAHQKAQKKQQEQAKTNKEKGQAFLKKNKSKEGVKTTDSGLEYKILEEGNGSSPSPGDTVLVNYTGKHLNGKTFQTNDSVSIALTRIIPGWKEGLQLMHEGAVYKFWIPGKLAYGTHTRPGGPIGADETLVFKVKLLKVGNK
jgi:FKBP-type peptidyl-prolyl cis-trans isomerase